MQVCFCFSEINKQPDLCIFWKMVKGHQYGYQMIDPDLESKKMFIYRRLLQFFTFYKYKQKMRTNFNLVIFSQNLINMGIKWKLETWWLNMLSMYQFLCLFMLIPSYPLMPHICWDPLPTDMLSAEAKMVAADPPSFCCFRKKYHICLN